MMAELQLDEDLRKVQLHKKQDPEDLPGNMSALEVKFRIPLAAKKKDAVVLRVQKKEYSAVMTVICTSIHSAHTQSDVAEELVETMHKQWRINGNKIKSKERSDDDGHETVLT